MNALNELDRIRQSGIPFDIELVQDRFLVSIGPDPACPQGLSLASSFDEAVYWLKEQLKLHYPNSAYARRLRIN